MCTCAIVCTRVRGRGCASIGVHGHACTLGHTQCVGLRACTGCAWGQLVHLRAGYRQVPKRLCGGARRAFRLPEHMSTDTSLVFGSCSTRILAWCCGGQERGTVRGGAGIPEAVASPRLPLSPADPRVCVTLSLPQSGTFPCFAWGIFQRDQLPCLVQSWHLLPKVMTVTSAAGGTPQRCSELTASLSLMLAIYHAIDIFKKAKSKVQRRHHQSKSYYECC